MQSKPRITVDKLHLINRLNQFLHIAMTTITKIHSYTHLSDQQKYRVLA